MATLFKKQALILISGMTCRTLLNLLGSVGNAPVSMTRGGFALVIAGNRDDRKSQQEMVPGVHPGSEQNNKIRKDSRHENLSPRMDTQGWAEGGHRFWKETGPLGEKLCLRHQKHEISPIGVYAIITLARGFARRGVSILMKAAAQTRQSRREVIPPCHAVSDTEGYHPPRSPWVLLSPLLIAERKVRLPHSLIGPWLAKKLGNCGTWLSWLILSFSLYLACLGISPFANQLFVHTVISFIQPSQWRPAIPDVGLLDSKIMLSKSLGRAWYAYV